MPPIDRAATWIGAVRRLLSLSLRRVFRAGAVAALGILVVEIFLHVALGARELRNGYRWWYAFLRRSLDADYVTVYHGMNDLFQHANGGMRVVPKQNYSGRVFEPFVYEGDASREALWREVLRSLTRRSLLVMLIREQRKALSGADRAWVHAPDPAGLEAFAIRYRALLDQIEASGSTPIPMTFAVADPDGSDAPDREKIERSFAIWLEGQGISLDAGRQILERQNQGIAALSHTRGDSLADVASAVPGDRQHFIDACHLTVEGDLRIAETLAETLMPLIDALPSSG